MKNNQYFFVVFLSVLISVSCSNNDDSSDLMDIGLIGTWVYTEMDDGEEFNITLTFNSNNTGILVTKTTFNGETETESENFTWSTSGNKLTFNISGETPFMVTYSISGKNLSITDQDGFVTVLTKV